MTTIDEITGILESKGLRFHSDRTTGCILLGFEMKNYRDAAGQACLPLVLRLMESGRFLSIEAIRAYHCAADSPRLAAVLQTAMHAVYGVKMLRWEFDPSDGELRASIHLPVMDAVLTGDQLLRILIALSELVDAGDAAMRRALETGLPQSPAAPAPLAALSGFLEMLAALTGGSVGPARCTNPVETPGVPTSPRFRPDLN